MLHAVQFHSTIFMLQILKDLVVENIQVTLMKQQHYHTLKY